MPSDKTSEQGATQQQKNHNHLNHSVDNESDLNTEEDDNGPDLIHGASAEDEAEEKAPAPKRKPTKLASRKRQKKAQNDSFVEEQASNRQLENHHMQMQPQVQMMAQAKDEKKNPLKLRLDLNLDIEIELRAKIHGDITLSLL